MRRASGAFACGFLLIIWAGITQPVAVAQSWVPFVGTQEQIVYRLLPTGKQAISESRGVFMRNADGSIYNRNQLVEGLPAGAEFAAMFMDAKTGKTYRINYRAKSATTLPGVSGTSLPMQPPTDVHPKGGVPLGEKVISGVQCIGWRVVRSTGRTTEIWYAPSLNYLTVSATIIDTNQNEETDLVMVTLEPGRQPAPQYFEIPQDFTVR